MITRRTLLAASAGFTPYCLAAARTGPRSPDPGMVTDTIREQLRTIVDSGVPGESRVG